ncbi:MAG: hypothetical protein WCK75_08300 [Elusimicrobiota bacterium]
MIKEEIISGIIEKLIKKYPSEAGRIAPCVRQTARLWEKKDGTGREFRDFCLNYFLTGGQLETLFSRFEQKLEYTNGHFTALTLKLRLEMDTDTGPLHPADQLFASYSPASHFTEDMFKVKLAFLTLLNFPARSLADCLRDGEGWSREEWAKARLARRFAYRVPAEINQLLITAYAEAESYINSYNINMERVTDEKGDRVFPKGLRLISHWGLRDHLKSLYAESDGLKKQRIILSLMERVIASEIPAKAVNSERGLYNPLLNTLDNKPAVREPDTRYQRFLDIFRAHLEEDKYYPLEPTHILRKFNLVREIPEGEVEAMFVSLLEAPEGRAVADLIKKKLGRELEPFDIWYPGFKGRADIRESELDRAVTDRYKSPADFEKDIANILVKLGFVRETAEFVAARVQIDAARGAGHAWGPGMRTEKARLRTRVPSGGMNYQGFNTAMHELGHCTEQIFSMYKVDHTLLEGVPNTAFTEGFAFVFQDRDMEVLGLHKPDKNSEALKALDSFWSAREIAGVALVDMNVWRWLYQNKDATAEDLRQAVGVIARGIWDKYYAPLFGVKDSPLLAIYSHMINYGMYLPDYPLGHIIAFQIEEYFKTHKLGDEMERMCRLGSITPRDWMRQAVGAEISPAPMISAAAEAVRSYKP